jgi:hypothetical protein
MLAGCSGVVADVQNRLGTCGESEPKRGRLRQRHRGLDRPAGDE